MNQAPGWHAFVLVGILLALGVLPLGFLLAPSPSAAQVIMGRLIDTTSDEPIDQGMVALVEEATGEERARTLSDAFGRYLVEAPGPGRYLLRVDRLGYASAHSEVLELAAGDTVVHRIEANFEPVALEGIEVEGEGRCRVRPEEGRATARVWEEARKALQAADWTGEIQSYRDRLLSFERVLDREARRVREERSERQRGFARSPITSRPAGELIQEGFARRSEEGGWLYFAPDAEVLLSDAFLDTHCFSLRRGDDEREGWLGLRFEPVRGRDVVEISGTFWFDPGRGALERLEFRYENLERELDTTLNDRVGGEVVFQGLPNGAWIVREWRIRMPLLAMQGRPGEYGRRPTLTALHEVGGMVRQVGTPDGEVVLSAELATLTGVVVDSTGTEPRAGVEVRVEGTDRRTRTGPDGRFRFSELQEGTYRLAYAPPELAELGGEPEPVEVTVSEGEVQSVRLRAPARGEALAEACRRQFAEEVVGEGGAPEYDEDEIGVLTGLVREEGGGPPVEGAEVRLSWTDWGFRGQMRGGEMVDYDISADGWSLETETDAGGRFVACGVPTGQPVRAAATWGVFEGEEVELRILAGRGHARGELEVPVRTTVAVGGRVVDWQSGAPLAGARVELVGTDAGAVETDAEGRFVLGEVSPGRHPLAVEHGAWEGVADTVEVNSGRNLDLEVRVPSEAVEIEGITVEVEVRSEEERADRARGFAADRVGPSEMAGIADRVYDFAGLLREMGSPRIRVGEYANSNAGVGFCVRVNERDRTSGRCPPVLVVVDGQILQAPVGSRQNTGIEFNFTLESLNRLNADQIESVQVLSSTQAYFRFGRRGQYGAILIETREGAGEGQGEGEREGGSPGRS